MKILPETRLGKWAVVLAGIFVLGYAFTFVAAQMFFVAMGMLTVGLGLAIGVAGTAALVLSLISLFNKGERSFLAFMSLAVGLYALVFLSFLVWLTFFGGSLIHLNF